MMQIATRRLKIIVIAGAAMAGSIVTQSAIGARQTQHVDISGRNVSLADRVGAGDSPALIVQFMGDIHGSIDSCG